MASVTEQPATAEETPVADAPVVEQESDTDAPDTDDEAETDDADETGDEELSETDEDDTGDKPAVEDVKDDETFVVKVNGKEEEVTAAELVAGYQRNQDYHNKRRADAEARRTWEAQKEVETKNLKQALQMWSLPVSSEPKPEQFVGKPQDFMQAYQRWQDTAKRQNEAKTLLQALEKEDTQNKLAKRNTTLLEAIPEWSDEATAKAEFSKMVDFAQDRYGFTPEEVVNVTDANMILMLRDAVKGADITSKPVKLQRKTATKPAKTSSVKVEGDPREKARKEAMRKLKTNSKLSDDDFASLIME